MIYLIPGDYLLYKKTCQISTNYIFRAKSLKNKKSNIPCEQSYRTDVLSLQLKTQKSCTFHHLSATNYRHQHAVTIDLGVGELPLDHRYQINANSNPQKISVIYTTPFLSGHNKNRKALVKENSNRQHFFFNQLNQAISQHQADAISYSSLKLFSK